MSLPIILALAWVTIGLSLSTLKKKGKKPEKKPPQPRQPSNRGEGHVPTIGPNQEKKLEQLEVLKNAGLLDPEEYAEKKRKILR